MYFVINAPLMKPSSPSPRRQLGLFDEASAPSEPPERQAQVAACNYWDYCPNCGMHLHNAGCKYRCPRCHYFMSCSDFD